MHTSAVILEHLELLADDVGRLRRRAENELDVWTLDRIGCHVQSIAAILEPTAAAIAAEYAPDDPVAIDEALRITDTLKNRWPRRLGLEAAA